MAKPFYLNGEWKKSDEELRVYNPFNQEPIDSIHLASAQDMETAISSAQNLFQNKSLLSTYQRSEILLQIASLIKEKKKVLSETISLESGKPLTEAEVEVERSVNVFSLAAHHLNSQKEDIIPLDVNPFSENRMGLVKRFPIGPILGIAPFNFPLNLVSHKVAPALATGNPIIIKPSSDTPLTALLLAKIIDQTSLPQGSFQVIPCQRELANEMIEDPRLALISFTGSGKVGWGIKNRCGKKKVLLELGGDAAVYLHDDAPLDYAVDRCILGAFAFAGQICISVQRIFLHEKIYEDFKKSFVEKASALKVGNPLQRDTKVGPLITEKESKRIAEWVQEAVQKGARLLCSKEGDKGFYYPTVLENVPSDCRLFKEEVFGPVVYLEKVNSPKEAFQKINQSQFGLQAGLFTNRQDILFEAFRTLQVGGVIANDIPTFRVDNMPYGGVKNSGYGREGVPYAMQHMTEERLLVLCQKPK